MRAKGALDEIVPARESMSACEMPYSVVMV